MKRFNPPVGAGAMLLKYLPETGACPQLTH
jgi:hypothetical protein